MNEKRKKLGLALAGGVARGRAHLGVIQVLEEAGIVADFVSGVSTGSIVGAIYATGADIDQLTVISRAFSWRRMVRLPVLNPFRSGIDRLGLLDFHNLEMLLIRLIGDVTFEELQKPFVVGVTDLITGEPININTGRVAAAVRASSSVPGVVVPSRWGDRLVCDGFASNNLRIQVLREMGADVVLGVNIMPLAHHRPRNFFWAGSTAVTNLIVKSGDPPESADLMIEPDVAEMDYLIPDSIELVQRGRAAAVAVLPQLRALLA